MASIIADRRLYLDAAKERAVEDGDPSAAYLLATPGTEVGAEEAKRLGLSVKGGAIVLPTAEPEPNPPKGDDAPDPPKPKRGKK